MASQYVGIVYGIFDRRIRSVVIPDGDDQLDDPRLVTPCDTAIMKVVRSVYELNSNPDELANALGLMP